MISFKTISTFRTRLANLLAIRKGVYSGVPAEIKKEKLSKANGYRLIYMVSTITERVMFLDIYPKRGPLQQLDIEDKEILRLIEEFNTEAASSTLQDYEFQSK